VVVVLVIVGAVACLAVGALNVGAPKKMTRGDFRSAVMYKTPKNVIKAVGRPDSTQESGSGDEYWYYSDCTVDEVTGRTDSRVQVVFRGGLVDSVNFY
jgi:hypothetical protein